MGGLIFKVFGRMIRNGVDGLLSRIGLKRRAPLMAHNPLTVWDATKTGTGISVILGWLAAAIGVAALFFGGYIEGAEAISYALPLIAGLGIVFGALRLRISGSKTVVANRAYIEGAVAAILEAIGNGGAKTDPGAPKISVSMPDPERAISIALDRLKADKR
jgi:hypothetical protein